MRNKFEEIMQSLIECFNLNASRNAYGEEEECHECDCMEVCPNKPPRAVEEHSDTNMLLKDVKLEK